MQALRVFLKSFHFLTIGIFCCLGMSFFLGLLDLPESQSLRAAKAAVAGSASLSVPAAPDDFSTMLRDGFLEIHGTIREGDTLNHSFQRNKVPFQTSTQIFSTLGNMLNFNNLRPGDRYSIIVDENSNLLKCVYEVNPLESYTVKFTDDGYLAERNRIFLETRKVRISGVVDTSVFAAFPADIKTPRLVYSFADIFASRVDFNTETRPGDSFSLIVDEYYRFDEFVGYGPIQAARFERADGETFEAFRFRTDKDSATYFDSDGKELGASFIRSPVQIGRITSRFSRRRMHPILKVVRQHLGVDLAAPRGTPVMAAADGRIVSIGTNGGFGKQIIIAHGVDYRTHYGHFSRFKKGLKVGSMVKQKQIIGYVGSTGLATGPHLDYRVQQHGVFRNPFSVRFQPRSFLKGAELARLKEKIGDIAPKLYAEHGDSLLEVTTMSISGGQQLTML
jgi:murein DD-endopeptidase MepM/ murein hydrolase activator NlpD